LNEPTDGELQIFRGIVFQICRALYLKGWRHIDVYTAGFANRWLVIL